VADHFEPVVSDRENALNLGDVPTAAPRL